MGSNNRIFVQIASYRDPELVSTLEDCIAKASSPDGLRFGICWQHDETESLAEYVGDDRFRILDVHWSESKGVCWARHEIQKLYGGEEYTLQLDSHHRFAENWDEQLIEMMRQTGCEKPILTAHTPPYDPDRWEPGSPGPEDRDSRAYKIVAKSFSANGMIQLASEQIQNWQTLLRPLHARFLSCHFYFTLGGHCEECSYDSLLYSGEQEMNMTLRSFSMGYDLFHPHRSVVWHEYERRGKPKHWDDHTEKLVRGGMTDVSSAQRTLSSQERMRQLLQREAQGTDVGPYGLGNERTIEAYEKYAGIDFRNCRFHRDTLVAKEPPNVYRDPDRWDTEFFDGALAMQKRDDYFAFFRRSGVRFPAAGNLSKPAIGSLSPGCRTCINGTWSCIFITDACTRSCFYCPVAQKKQDVGNPASGPEKVFFDSVDEYISFLRTFDFKGVSFSGGEPFLVLDRVLEYLKEIRRVFGDRHYIWVYTNGDCVSEEKLSLLHQAGLDEVRFDISANNYDLTVVRMAVGIVGTVTVEIPAIPEDVDRVKSLLKEMEGIGVKHLNLHQLMRTDHNAMAFDQRGYSPVNRKDHPVNVPIMESELAACEILKHAVEAGVQMGINYCSSCYKARFQGAGHRKRAAGLCRDKKATMTETGYLSQLAIDASGDEARYVKENLGEDEWEITVEGEKSELRFSAEHLDLLLRESYAEADVIYHVENIEPVCGGGGEGENSGGGPFTKMSIQTSVAFRLALENSTSAFLFYRLFVEKRAVERVVDELRELYKVDDDGLEAIKNDVTAFYNRFREAEYLPMDLPPYE